MRVTKVLYGQSLSDLCAEDNLFVAADLNGIGITDALVPGVIMSIPIEAEKTLIKETLDVVEQPTPIITEAGQTWVDMTIQELGDEERIFDLCDANNAGITDDLAPSTSITSLLIDDDNIATVALLRQIKPSSLYFGVGDPAPEGIDYWAIEIDFIVS